MRNRDGSAVGFKYMEQPSNLQKLISVISETDLFFKTQAQKQVNVALTLRNWLIGLYIVEYEQNGADRAEYGEKLIEKLLSSEIEQ